MSNIINSNSVSRGLVNGALVAGAAMVLEKESGKEALYDGGVMVGASLLSDAVVNSWVSPFTPAGSSLVFADGITYGGLEAAWDSNERSWSKFFMNSIIGIASSWVGGNIIRPMGIMNISATNPPSARYAAAQSAIQPPVAVPIASAYATL